MCVPAAFRTGEITLDAKVAAARRVLGRELKTYLGSPEAAFFRYLAELQRFGS